MKDFSGFLKDFEALCKRYDIDVVMDSGVLEGNKPVVYLREGYIKQRLLLSFERWLPCTEDNLKECSVCSRELNVVDFM